MPPMTHPGEPLADALRAGAAAVEPKALRTYTPTQAVFAESAGVYHWTPDGRRLFDYTSGVLVSNLGHNPAGWLRRFWGYMGWAGLPAMPDGGYLPAAALTTYNAVTPLEVAASTRLVETLKRRPGGGRLDLVVWAASGSEAVQKALWAGMARDPARPLVLATRHGFHGKKGLSQAVSGCEADAERDPRVVFTRFPMAECLDIDARTAPFDSTPFRAELDALWAEHGGRIGTLITEPYLGGGGSYHPPAAYLQLLGDFCRTRDIVFVLDEVQANFGRTAALFAFEHYGVEPDIVVLGKGLGNGVPVAAAVGRRDLFGPMGYGDASDTWSGNPLSCAAVLATLDEFEAGDVFGHARRVSAVIEAGLVELKRSRAVAHVRGEDGGMVWGVEFADHAGRPAADWANAFVLEAYRGDGPGGDGVHLLGPLAKKVVRVAPPLTITADEATAAGAILSAAVARMAATARPVTAEPVFAPVGF